MLTRSRGAASLRVVITLKEQLISRVIDTSNIEAVLEHSPIYKYLVSRSPFLCEKNELCHKEH